MPYIEKESREKLNPTLNTISEKINTVGSLNYCITKLCLNLLNRTTISYTSLNEIIGVLECSKLEFYRRALSMYEEQKISDNGDVYADFKHTLENERLKKKAIVYKAKLKK